VATVRKTFTLAEDVARQLAEQSEGEDRSMSRIVTRALQAYFAAAKRKS
jgi:hypothetical protein